MVRTTYLEITSKAQWIRRDRSRTGLDIRECSVKKPQWNRFLYEYVGADWKWVYRLPWSLEQWRAYVTAENLRTFVAFREASIVGYYELRRDGEGVETDGGRLLQQHLDWVPTVVRERRVGVELDRQHGRP